MSQMTDVIQAAGTLINAAATILIGVISIGFYRRTSQISHCGNRHEALHKCIERFDRIWSTRDSEHTFLHPKMFYESFWNFQHEQFILWWRYGLIDLDLFENWMITRQQQWLENEKIGGMSYRTGYEQTVGQWKKPEFRRFMDAVHEDAIAAVQIWSKHQVPAIAAPVKAPFWGKSLFR